MKALRAAGGSAQHPLSVGALTQEIRSLLEESLGEVWVEGEISNLRNPGSGHLYFTLKDHESTLHAVMFRGDTARLRFTPKDGMATVIKGTLTVYEPRGQYQLQVTQMRPRGQGSLQERFEALKRKLAEEGLFSLERKRSLPVFPERIGLVTSTQGAAIQDFIKIIQRRAPGIHLLVRNVRVQGAGAELEIAAAITAFSQERQVDTLVVMRGGGSLEDLWCFNEEVVARSLFSCQIPVISAVGHETDFTLADLVADVRAPTPSAAAEIVARDWGEWREAVRVWRERLGRAAQGELDRARHRWHRLANHYVFREPQRVIQAFQQRLDDHRSDLARALRQAVQDRRRRWESLALRWRHCRPSLRISEHGRHLQQLQARLRNLGPEATLHRGFALVTHQGHIVRTAHPSLAKAELVIRLAQGSLTATVTQAG